MVKMMVIYLTSVKSVLSEVNNCREKAHFQQVAYSVHKDVITSVCFACNKVTTNISME